MYLVLNLECGHNNAQLHSRPRGPVLTMAMSSLDRLTWKTPRFEHRVISCYTAKLYLFEGLPAPPHAPREQPISAMGGGTPTIFGIT